MSDRPRIGRRPKRLREKKRNAVHVYLDDHEFRTVRDKARQVGKPVSEFARERMLS